MPFLFYKLYFLLLIFFPFALSIEPITTGLSLLSAVALVPSIYFGLRLKFPWVDEEQCGRKKNKQAADELLFNLRKRLYGQHLVIQTVSKSVEDHIMKNKSKKALVMAFHGWTGVGKNHVGKIIADALYEKGSKSKAVHWYIAPRDFPHSGEVKRYRKKLYSEIAEYTKRCEQSLFIFDEVDKMTPGVIDALKPFLDFYEDIDGIDYRKNIFVFLSNAGGSDITKVAFDFWLEGKEREEITMKDIESLINQDAFNEEGGLYHSEVIGRNLIDVFVPFLPLEKRHVKECIEQEMNNREIDFSEHFVNKIAEQMIYYPPEFELFSTSGCKKVIHKVDLYSYDNIIF